MAMAYVSMDTLGKFEKIVVQPREKVQYISSSGRHFAYYNPTTKHVKYRFLGKDREEEEITNVFQKTCPTLSDLDVHANEKKVYVAMAYYSIPQDRFSIDIAVIDRETFRVEQYSLPMAAERHETFIRRCAFIVYHGCLSLVSWSIDGMRSVHRIGSAKWSFHRYPFKVYHVMVSGSTVGVLDNDFIFHVFFPDGAYRNMTLENITSPVSACHFSMGAKQLTIGFPDGTVRVHFLNSCFTKKFSVPVRHVYGDADMLMVFLENGDVSIGEIKESLPEVARWRNVFDSGSMDRYIFRAPYLVVDGDREGFAVRGWKSIPSQTGLLSRIQEATKARERTEKGVNGGVDFEQFLKGNETDG